MNNDIDRVSFVAMLRQMREELLQDKLEVASKKQPEDAAFLRGRIAMLEHWLETLMQLL